MQLKIVYIRWGCNYILWIILGSLIGVPVFLWQTMENIVNDLETKYSSTAGTGFPYLRRSTPCYEAH
jgi:hypothetical protein